MGVTGTDPHWVKNSRITFDSPQTWLLTNSPLLTGRLPANINSQSHRPAGYVIYCILTIEEARERKILRKSYSRGNRFTVFIEKHPCMSGPTQFTTTLFKGQPTEKNCSNKVYCFKNLDWSYVKKIYSTHYQISKKNLVPELSCPAMLVL